jgi:hypothetical protein
LFGTGAAERQQMLGSLGQETLPGAPTLAGETRQETALGQEMVDRQAGIDRARKLLAISEGLRRATRGVANLGGAVPVDVPVQDVAAREEVARAEDVVSPQERSALEEALGVTLPAGVGRANLHKMLPTLSTVMGRREAAARAKGTQEAVLGEKAKRRISVQSRHQDRMSRELDKILLKAGADFERNPRVKAQRDMIDQGRIALRALDLDTQQADVAAAIAIARASGEKGVLSDQDVARWLNRADIPGRLKTLVSRAVQGRLIPEHRGELRDIVNGAIEERMSIVKGEAGRMATRHADVFPQFDRERVYEQILQPEQGLLPESAAGTPSTMIRVRNKSSGEMGEVTAADWESATPDEKAEYEVVK